MHELPVSSVKILYIAIGGGSQSSGSEVSELDESLSPLNASKEDILTDSTVTERIPYTRYMDWMTNLPKRLHSIPFSRLSIPGKLFSLLLLHYFNILQ